MFPSPASLDDPWKFLKTNEGLEDLEKVVHPNQRLARHAAACDIQIHGAI